MYGYTESPPRDVTENNEMYTFFSARNPIAEKEIRKIKKYGILAGAALIGVSVMQIIVSLMLSSQNLMTLYRTDAAYQGAATAVFQLIYLFLPFFAVFLFYNRKDRNCVYIFDAPRDGRNFVLLTFAGLAVCFIGDSLTNLSLSLFSVLGVDFLSGAEDVSNPQSGDIAGAALAVLGYAVMPALLEEFAFRGVLLQPLRKFGDGFAICISSLAFALVHGNMVQIPFAFVAGLALGYVSVATGSIWAGSLVHFLNNLLSVVFALLGESDRAFGNFAYNVISAAVIILGAAAAFMYVRGGYYRLKKKKMILKPREKAAAFLCAPTMVIAVAQAEFSTFTMQNTKSFLGVVLLSAAAVVIAVVYSKNINKIKNDKRFDPGKGYTFSKIAAVVSSVLLVIYAALAAWVN